MTINEEMYKEFSNVVIGEDSISNDALLQVLKDYAVCIMFMILVICSIGVVKFLESRKFT